MCITPLWVLLFVIAGCASSSIEGNPATAQNHISNREPLHLNYVGPGSTEQIIGVENQELRFTEYVENWRVKIERIGTLNYPEEAKGRLSGRLVLSVSINSDGTVRQVKVVTSSGHRILDDAARRIANMAAPYAPFTQEMKRDTDVLEIIRAWDFTHKNQIEAK